MSLMSFQHYVNMYRRDNQFHNTHVLAFRLVLLLLLQLLLLISSRKSEQHTDFDVWYNLL